MMLSPSQSHDAGKHVRSVRPIIGDIRFDYIIKLVSPDFCVSCSLKIFDPMILTSSEMIPSRINYYQDGCKRVIFGFVILSTFICWCSSLKKNFPFSYETFFKVSVLGLPWWSSG